MSGKLKHGNYANEGYPRVCAGKYRGEYLHILVWEWFNGPVPAGYDIHHKDGDKSNFAPDNLELVEHSEHGRISRRAQLEYAARKRKAQVRRARHGVRRVRIAETASAIPF